MSAHILIIDDADHIRSVLAVTLEFKGYSVTGAENGQAGLDAAAAHKPDFIFCDIEMPVMNGLEFVRRFRAEVDPNTPILMLTAEGDELIKRAMEAGATGSIRKPFEPIQLLKLLEKHLGGA